MFINDNYPESANCDGSLQSEEDWASRFVKTHIGNNVSIGSNVTILGNVTVGDCSIIGAGSVVTKNIPSGQIWAGNPANMLRENREKIDT
jgi:acetyltransferase-like isoleucine patch superfamily enzyme